MTKLDRAHVLAHRYHVNGLEARLPHSDLVTACKPGLQDSAPRSAVLSLHARVEEVGLDDWSDRRLTQVWGPRGAIYLIPKEDLAVFTLGMQPRDEERLADLQEKAHRVLRTLDGRPQRHGPILDAIPSIGDVRELLWISTTGWFLPIWDASTTAIYPAEPAEGDAEESRCELARRFLRFLGPSTTEGFRWWSGVNNEDAVKTMAQLGPELATVEVGGEEGVMLAADIERAESAEHPRGLRLLPPDDTYISRLCGPLLVPDGGLHSRLFPRGPLPGAAIRDGEVVATWRRRGRRLTMIPFPGTEVGPLMDAVMEAARALPLPGEAESTVVDWYAD